MDQIKYNSASNVIRFEFPEEWNPEDLTGLTLQIADTQDNELLTATAVTLYTATTLNGDVDRYASEITLTWSATALATGDPLLIIGASARERVRIKGDADSATDTYELESILDNAFDTGDAVHGCWGTYTLDTTTVADYTAGMELVLNWTPTGTGQPTTTQAQIAKSSVDLEGLRLEFSRTYPRAYSSFIDPVDRFKDMVDIATARLRIKVEAMLIQWDRVVDQSVLMPSMISMLAYLWVINGDDDLEYEYGKIDLQLGKDLNELKQIVIWQDDNQDGKKTEEEETSHEHIFGRQW